MAASAVEAQTFLTSQTLFAISIGKPLPKD